MASTALVHFNTERGGARVEAADGESGSDDALRLRWERRLT